MEALGKGVLAKRFKLNPQTQHPDNTEQKMETTRFNLNQNEIPRSYYNLLADLPSSPPPTLHPVTHQPIGPDDLAPLFPMCLIEQEVATDREIEIPGPVLEALSLFRPTPLVRATRLEKAIGTRSRIYYKNESVSPAGSHKPNTAIAQAYYNSTEGVRRLTTETGAGQWGSALSLACRLFEIECKVYMVRVSYDHKPYRRSMIHTWGAEVIPSPSPHTESGKRILAEHPDSPGSLGIAISEAVEEAAGRDDTKYSLGSVLNHVLLHQTVIGLEAEKQMAAAGANPDVVIGCVGGGSNFAGIAFPFVRRVVNGEKIKILAVEPQACPTLSRGPYRYDFGDTAQLTPLLPMFTLGHDFVPPAIHAGGLRYHGVSPLLSHLLKEGIIEAEAFGQSQVFEAAITFARSEGIVPAPESSHAIFAAISEARAADEEGVERNILFNLSGHGHFDMAAYDEYFNGGIEDFSLPQENIDAALDRISHLPLI